MVEQEHTLAPVTEAAGIVTLALFQDLDGSVVGLVKSDWAQYQIGAPCHDRGRPFDSSSLR